MLDLDLGGIVSSVESSFRETIFNDPLITGVKGRTFLTTFYFISNESKFKAATRITPESNNSWPLDPLSHDDVGMASLGLRVVVMVLSADLLELWVWNLGATPTHDLSVIDKVAFKRKDLIQPKRRFEGLYFIYQKEGLYFVWINYFSQNFPLIDCSSLGENFGGPICRS